MVGLWIVHLHLLLLSRIALHDIIGDAILGRQVLVCNHLLLILEHLDSLIISIFKILLSLVNLNIQQSQVSLLSCQRILLVVVSRKSQRHRPIISMIHGGVIALLRYPANDLAPRDQHKNACAAQGRVSVLERHERDSRVDVTVGLGEFGRGRLFLLFVYQNKEGDCPN